MAGADALLLLVNHTELRALNPAALAALTPARIAIDTTNGWAAAPWQAAGFTFFRLGSRK